MAYMKQETHKGDKTMLHTDLTYFIHFETKVIYIRCQ